VSIGASRDSSAAYYLSDIEHYVYAGDTPLHLAAAAYQTRLANGSGSTPLHLTVQNTGRGDSGSVAARKQQRQILQLHLSHGVYGAGGR
jgi:hypothetical protein